MVIKTFFRNSITVLLILLLKTTSVWAGSPAVLVEPFSYLPTTKTTSTVAAADADSIKIARIIEDGVKSVLIRSGKQVQSEQSDAIDSPTEKISGWVTVIKDSPLAVCRRYSLDNGVWKLEAIAQAKTEKIQDVLLLIPDIMDQLYGRDKVDVPRPVEQIIVLPTFLKIPVGQSRRLEVIALDGNGMPVPKVKYILRSSDESKVTVSEDGLVEAESPGDANISVRVIQSQIKGNPIASAAVSVTTPPIGLRYGVRYAGRTAGFAAGLRLAPSIEFKGKKDTADILSNTTNPLSYVTSIFSSMLGSGLSSVGLDASKDSMLLTLNAIQRNGKSLYGTGVGIAMPLQEKGEQGLDVRLFMGTAVSFSARGTMRFPIDIVFDLLFPGGEEAPRLTLSLLSGIDLFQ